MKETILEIGTPTRVPAITNPMGQYWPQPPRENILLDGTHALMGQQSFDMLQDYSASQPTGVYTGKMWRCNFKGKWWLMWYEPDPLNPDRCLTNFREILTVS